jgi:2-oxoglutarate ferredoxin oxidoreductase subunit alpha
MDVLAQGGVPADYMRIRAFPFHEDVEVFLAEHDHCFVVEQNRDAQLKALLTLETSVPKEKLRSVLVYGGFPLSARHVVEGILGPAPAPAGAETSKRRRVPELAPK